MSFEKQGADLLIKYTHSYRPDSWSWYHFGSQEISSSFLIKNYKKDQYIFGVGVIKANSKKVEEHYKKYHDRFRTFAQSDSKYNQYASQKRYEAIDLQRKDYANKVVKVINDSVHIGATYVPMVF